VLDELRTQYHLVPLIEQARAIMGTHSAQ